MRKIFRILISPITKLIDYYKLQKKLKELRKRDPFIYK